jgi:glycosyltransferase involved in cell wall biosynthesis
LRLSVVVPATNRPPTLERCLAAIRGAAEPPEELIVVEDAPGPGPAAARNAGAKRATSNVVVFVDADVLPHPDAFRRIRAAFDSDPQLVALFGCYDDRPEAPGVVSSFRNLLHHHVHRQAAAPAGTFWAGLGAVRRDEVLRAGGFDADRYRVPSIEDIDGARLELDGALQGTHLKSWSLAEMVRTDFSRRGVPWVELLLRERRVPSALNLRWRHRLSAAASLALAASLAVRKPRPAVASVLALVALNHSLYVLIWRQRGRPAAAATGIALHAVHHLTGACALAFAGVRKVARLG